MHDEPFARTLSRRALRTVLDASPLLRPRLAGELPRNDADVPLDPETHLLLRLMELQGPPPFTRGVGAARSEMDLNAPLADVPAARLPRVTDRVLDVSPVPLPARVYLPRDSRTPLPALLYLHGGGWVIGSIDSHDGVCRHLAREADCVVISVDYRLAPEHRFPAAIDDALAAFRWVVAHASELRIDPSRIAVGGDSAGGNLAALVSLATRGDRVPVAHQFLVYPATDLSRSFESHRLFAEGFLLERRTIEWFLERYLRSSDDPRDPRCSPYHERDLSGAPPATLITAGFDPLRDEGEAYAERLADAGVKVDVKREDRLIHGFFNMGGVVALAREAVDRAARSLRQALHPATRA